MSVQRKRLIELIEFSRQSALLRSKPVASVESHGVFALYEHEIQGLPGIRLNVNGSESEDEIWISVERLHETRPPDVSSAVLRPWIQVAQSPNEEPKLREVADGASLIAAGTHSSSSITSGHSRPVIDPKATITLSEYSQADQIRALFRTYVDTRWRSWAEEEKRRLKTISLYSKLFTLKQQLEGGIVETQLELVWGAGIGIWRSNNYSVCYPLVGRLVEMSLNPVTAEIEIRPRDVDARLEVDWYAAVDNPGVAYLENEAKKFFETAETTFSPFDKGSFEPLLRAAVTNLDPHGTYWPNEVPAEDRTLPKADNKLKVTDTWVLFARPRTNNVFLQDLEKLKNQAEKEEKFPPAVNAIVTDPETKNPIIELPSFRGISASCQSGSGTCSGKARDLYFPKPFNDEQVRIVQLLDVSDGVVVQGPPGTGKTHTIANIICHYLAEGKRVLVTSMKDPALAVLREQLPKEIRPLAISLLASEQDGMKQFEHSIQKIASDVQSLDREKTAKDINHLDESIDALHGRLADIDFKVNDWAKRNLSRIKLEDEEIAPQDAAREIADNIGQFEWFPDPLGIGPEFMPRFSDMDVMRLREARRVLGKDIGYLDASLPQIIEFPDVRVLLEVHQDISQFERLTQGIVKGAVPALADSSQETLSHAQALISDIEVIRRLRDEITEFHRSWAEYVHEQLRRHRNEKLFQMLDDLGYELEQAAEKRKKFIERPVNTPEDLELDENILAAVKNLAVGKSPFGIKGLFGKSLQKKQLESIRVLGCPPSNAEDWKHVADYLDCMKTLRSLAFRWNALSAELKIEAVKQDTPEGGVSAAQEHAIYCKIKQLVKAEEELQCKTVKVFPNWAHSREVTDNPQRLKQLETALMHHLTKSRLANVWAVKERFEKVLEGRSGRIIDDIRRFLSKTLGNPEIDDVRMQNEWSALMAELNRVSSLGSHLHILRDVTRKIESSGAPRFAALLKKPLDGAVDSLLPDDWRKTWRLKRLATYLASIDAQDELKKLAISRQEVEKDLSRAYRETVAKRTWLKLAENASPSIRSALAAYLNAIQKIGKGTGKRTMRYRQDARKAASQANPAVPCWIMPHYRVSETLPAELGCFDLVVIDEASQSDLTALPSLLRAKKALIVGDDKQVSPEAVGLEEEKIRSLMNRFLGSQVEAYRAQMSPDRSIYDLYKVVFATSAVMLKEHFRSVGPIIEYSKREFYNHELRPLRVPKKSERLDPPLIDVFVQDGYRKGDVNLPEVRFIVDEIKSIVEDPKLDKRSIGVVSLLADKQALAVWERLTNEIGPEVMQRHSIACGDARTFQGKERHIMFLSMVSAPNDIGAPLSRDTFAQRFNVAASRAKDRMYLVRSVELEHLSQADHYRRSLIKHFSTPFAQDEGRVQDLRSLCESPFERELYDELTQRGYWVRPQVRVGHYRIDMVVEGHNDSRLAIECDGDMHHGPDKWFDDMQRQRVLERAGWVFWRCFASTFIRRRKEMLEDLLRTLSERGIEPIGAEGAPRSMHTELRRICISADPVLQNKIQTSGASLKKEGLEEQKPVTSHGIKQNELPQKMVVDAQSIQPVSLKKQNKSSESAPTEVSAEPEVWFRLSHWAKVNNKFPTKDRVFAYKVGKYYANNWNLSDSQKKWAMDIWVRATNAGFNPDPEG
jgi:very-short-patch-repair endonuclease